MRHSQQHEVLLCQRNFLASMKRLLKAAKNREPPLYIIQIINLARSHIFIQHLKSCFAEYFKAVVTFSSIAWFSNKLQPQDEREKR